MTVLGLDWLDPHAVNGWSRPFSGGSVQLDAAIFWVDKVLGQRYQTILRSKASVIGTPTDWTQTVGNDVGVDHGDELNSGHKINDEPVSGTFEKVGNRGLPSASSNPQRLTPRPLLALP